MGIIITSTSCAHNYSIYVLLVVIIIKITHVVIT